MKVTLHTVLGIQQAIGKKLTEIDLPLESTVGDFIAYMKKTWGDKLSPHLIDPDKGTVLPYIRIMVNGQTINFPQEMETSLKEGDEIMILPLIAGG